MLCVAFFICKHYSFWGVNLMSNSSDSNTPKTYLTKTYSKSLNIGGKDILFVIEDASYTTIANEDIFVDKVSLDFIIDEIASTIKDNPLKNHNFPKTIVLSQKNLDIVDTPNDTEKDTATSDIKDVEDVNLSKGSKVAGSVPPINDLEQILNFDFEAVKNNKKSDLTDEKTPQTPETKEPQALEGNNTSEQKPSVQEKSTPQEKIASEKERPVSVDDSIIKAAEEDTFLKVYKPKYSFNDVYVDPVSKKRILSALILAKEKKRLYEDWGLKKTLKTARPLVLNFYGPPGTGKSMMAEAIANYLSRDVFLVNYSELESGTPGQTPKNIIKCFNKASECNAVLIFDEADSFLGKRLTNVSSAADYGINVTRSVMLIELEKFDGIIIFTTNFISNYDIAFKRRILASLEFKLPDEKGRAQIWNSHIPKELPLSPGITPSQLGYKYGGTTGADIKDIVLFSAVNCLEKGRERLTWEDFDEAYQTVKNRYSVV
jgi:SpoVK/Ycf46/Vps4 family AAA+-type ATPase